MPGCAGYKGMLTDSLGETVRVIEKVEISNTKTWFSYPGQSPSNLSVSVLICKMRVEPDDL